MGIQSIGQLVCQIVSLFIKKLWTSCLQIVVYGLNGLNGLRKLAYIKRQNYELVVK